jgi:hypothetical protein
MLRHVSITLDLPVNGTGSDYAGAISQAINQAASRGDLSGTDALAGLLAVLRLTSEASRNNHLSVLQHLAGQPQTL